jgi:hypothetical protein
VPISLAFKPIEHFEARACQRRGRQVNQAKPVLEMEDHATPIKISRKGRERGGAQLLKRCRSADGS